MKKITPILLLFSLSMPSFGADVFPQNNKKCVNIKSPCSSDPNSTCIKTVCNYDNLQKTLDLFLSQNQIIGKKINNIFEFEIFLSKNLPNELKKYSKHFVTEDTSLLEYEFSIVFILDKNNKVKSVRMF